MLLLLAILIALVYFIYSFRYKNTNLPPSPVAFPVIGHLHLLRDPIHRVLRDLSRKHGPVYFLRLGSRRALVVSSLSAAEECLTNQNDIVFANRPFNTISDLLMYNYTMVGAAPYGDHWRNLRRICSLEIFSTARLNASADIRRDEVRSLLQTLHEASSGSSVKVELRPMLMGLTFNVIMRMVAGKLDYGDEIDVKEEAREFAELAGLAEIGDFLPIFKVFDFSGHVKRAKRLASKMDEFLEKLVDQHRRNRGMAELENTMINHLLSLQESQPQYYTNEIIKGLVLAMLIAGPDTLALTIEWALANLLNHPEVLKKAKAEVNAVVGGDRLIDESDVDKCRYLENVISESLRLNPTTPLLVPHLSSADCKVAGYDIPRGVMLFVNVWAIQRDLSLWNEPESFIPERFDIGGERLIMPFGLGRRACPGAGLAQKIMGLVVGSLIQCFEWQTIDGMPVDMSEGKGFSVPMALPLVALCKSSYLPHL